MEKKRIFFCPLQFVYIRTIVFIVYARCKVAGILIVLCRTSHGKARNTVSDSKRKSHSIYIITKYIITRSGQIDSPAFNVFIPAGGILEGGPVVLGPAATDGFHLPPAACGRWTSKRHFEYFPKQAVPNPTSMIPKQSKKQQKMTLFLIRVDKTNPTPISTQK